MSFLKKIPLHLQILLALVIGTIWGAMFKVENDVFNAKAVVEGQKVEIEISDWESIELGNKSYQLVDANNFYKDVSSILPQEIIVIHKDKTHKSYLISHIEKQATPATIFRPLGSLFIKLLSFLAIPLVIASLIVGAASLDNIKKLGSIGGKTFLIYVCTTAIAITIGLSLANIIAPGKQIPDEIKKNMLSSVEKEAPSNIAQEMEIDLLDFIVEIVPKNPFKAMSSGNMLQIVFFSVMFGITLTFIEKEKSKPVLSFFSGVSDTMIKMVDFIMYLAPYGVFALIAATIADFGFEIVSTLLWYILTVILGLLLQNVLVYTSLLKFLGKFSIRTFFKEIRNAQAIGFSTSSSAATLPVTFECVEKMGVSKQVSGFVLPLGATINMDGTALYQGVATVFIAQIYGLDLNIVEQLTVVFTAVLASIGTAPVPGVGIIMLVMILQSVNIPPEGIALIMGVDRILDMMRTTTNVGGDAAVAVTVAGMEKNKLTA